MATPRSQMGVSVLPLHSQDTSSLSSPKTLPLRSDTGHNMRNLEDVMLSDVGQSQKDIFYDSSYLRNLEESHSQRQGVEQWVPGAWGGRSP